jgi:hypothetical protein
MDSLIAYQRIPETKAHKDHLRLLEVDSLKAH